MFTVLVTRNSFHRNDKVVKSGWTIHLFYQKQLVARWISNFTIDPVLATLKLDGTKITDDLYVVRYSWGTLPARVIDNAGAYPHAL